MKNPRYNKIADNYKTTEDKFKNATIAFIAGGLIGMIGELIIEGICHYTHISRTEASSYMIVFLIFIASMLTALGVYDKLVTKFRCGLLIPITGFAHAITSCALEYKKEGPIYGLGSNIFKLAGPVLLYGITAAWFFGMIRYLIGGGV